MKNIQSKTLKIKILTPANDPEPFSLCPGDQIFLGENGHLIFQIPVSNFYEKNWRGGRYAR
jgi:hypothetical protein